MFRKLITTEANSTAEVRAFFDKCAEAYSEQHGNPKRLLDYRIALIKQHAKPSDDDTVLDIGCGNGHHLMALANTIGRGIGIDLSPAMIEMAQASLLNSPWQNKLTFFSDNGEKLDSLVEQSIDLIICIGALEHMLDKASVLASAYRILKSRGRFFCLTVHGEYFWYRTLAPLFKLETKHLSTDKFLEKAEFTRLLKKSGFCRIESGYWTFIPKGDMPLALNFVCQGLDIIGRSFHLNSLRGGLWVCAWKE
ncbi:MAG: class I SAM-dependent methyltransferase [Blastocatellia bacterium]